MEFRKNYKSKNKSISKVLNNVESFISTINKLNKKYLYNIKIEKKNNEWIADMEVYEQTFNNTQEMVGAS